MDQNVPFAVSPCSSLDEKYQKNPTTLGTFL